MHNKLCFVYIYIFFQIHKKWCFIYICFFHMHKKLYFFYIYFCTCIKKNAICVFCFAIQTQWFIYYSKYITSHKNVSFINMVMWICYWHSITGRVFLFMFFFWIELSCIHVLFVCEYVVYTCIVCVWICLDLFPLDWIVQLYQVKGCRVQFNIFNKRAAGFNLACQQDKKGNSNM